MSDIKAGDLVQVIHSCCENGLGMIDAVAGFHKGMWSEICTCNCCGAVVAGAGDITAEVCGEHWPLSWLKKIPPLPEAK